MTTWSCTGLQPRGNTWLRLCPRQGRLRCRHVALCSWHRQAPSTCRDRIRSRHVAPSHGGPRDDTCSSAPAGSWTRPSSEEGSGDDTWLRHLRPLACLSPEAGSGAAAWPSVRGKPPPTARLMRQAHGPTTCACSDSPRTRAAEQVKRINSGGWLS